MIATLRTPARRIALAVALSVLAHAVVLWLPQVQLPHRESLSLQPLSAKLEALHKLEPKPVAIKPAPKLKRAKPPISKPPAPSEPPPAAATPEAPSLPANTVAAAEAPSVAEAAPPPEAAPPTEPAPPAAATASTAAEEEPEAANSLPRQALLTFAVYKGLDKFRIGEVQHQLEISGDAYTLYAVTQTVGLARMIKNLQIIQISRGKTGKHGLQPEKFEEERISGSSRQTLGAVFDWPSQKMHFSHGGEAALPAEAQDILSIFYQLSQLPLNREIVPVYVSKGKKLEKYELKVNAEEEIATPMGKLRTLPLHKLHAPGEDGFEIWLGLEYRLLPVKIRIIERSGEAAGEIVISGIQIAEK